MDSVSLVHLQILSAILFAAGLAAVLVRRNLFFVLMGVELMLNAANLSFVSWSRVQSGAGAMQGQVAPLFSIAIAAYMVAVLQRSSLGVAAVEATDRFSVNAAALSALAVVQIGCYLENELWVMPLFCGALALPRS